LVYKRPCETTWMGHGCVQRIAKNMHKYEAPPNPPCNVRSVEREKHARKPMVQMHLAISCVTDHEIRLDEPF